MSSTTMDGGTSAALLSFDGVSIQFETRVGLFGKSRPLHAVQDVSFELRRGEILGIVGESGSGKSTLGKLAMRMLKPTAGSIRYEGRCLQQYRGAALKQLRCDLQMVFQDPNASLNPRLTIEDSLREPLLLHRRGDANSQRQAIARLLDLVGLPATALQRYPHELSGGQKQRVVIARALALQPKVLVADEAVAALDASVKAQIINLLLDLKQQLDLSIIFISHDLPMVETLCDRVLVLYLGRAMEFAPRAAMAQGGQHPYTQALWRSSPSIDAAMSLSDEDPLTGEIPSPLNPPSGCVFHTRCPSAMPECRSQQPASHAISASHGVVCHLFSPKP